MSKILVECWQCDECGHVWIKSWGGKIPEQCASSKCRKRSWNKNEICVPEDPTSAGKSSATGLEDAGIEPVPTCMACEGSMVEGTGKSSGLWACQDVSCMRYGIEVRR